MIEVAQDEENSAKAAKAKFKEVFDSRFKERVRIVNSYLKRIRPSRNGCTWAAKEVGMDDDIHDTRQSVSESYTIPRRPTRSSGSKSLFGNKLF